MGQKIKYEFYIGFGGPEIKSNLESNGLDMLGLISSDTYNEK